jgi:porin
VLLGGAGGLRPAFAQSVEVPSTWGGDLGSRPRLSGNWGGVRDELGKRGVVLNVDVLLTPQSVLSGGRSTATELWGNVEYALLLDTHKLGLWPGGSVELEADTGFGNNVLQDSGALIPINTAATIPGVNERTTALMNATFTQGLSQTVSVALGKFNTLEAGETEFYGDYRSQFQNLALVSPPMTLEQVPLSAWGAELNWQASQNLGLSIQALNPSGTPTSNQVFGQGVDIVGGGQLTVNPFGLVGHQSLGFSWNDKDRYSLEQDPSNIARLLLYSKFPRLADPGPQLEQILREYFPQLLVPTVPPDYKSSSWALSYTADQYLWQPAGKSDAGIGVFVGAGVSDGNPNPVRYSWLAGLGGKAIVPGRPGDTFGLGVAITQFSSAFVPYLRARLDLGLDHENAFEMYYDASVTGWLNVSADLQVIDQGLARTLSGTQLTSLDTAVVLGLRFRVRF